MLEWCLGLLGSSFGVLAMWNRFVDWVSEGEEKGRIIPSCVGGLLDIGIILILPYCLSPYSLIVLPVGILVGYYLNTITLSVVTVLAAFVVVWAREKERAGIFPDWRDSTSMGLILSFLIMMWVTAFLVR